MSQLETVMTRGCLAKSYFQDETEEYLLKYCFRDGIKDYLAKSYFQDEDCEGLSGYSGRIEQG